MTGFAITVHVRDEDIVSARCVFIEPNPLKGLLTRSAGIAIPNTAAHEIRPAIPVHIQCRKADI
jgi:hypothetical protein